LSPGEEKIKKIAVLYGGLNQLSVELGHSPGYLRALIYKGKEAKLLDTVRRCEILHLATKDGGRVKWR